MKTGDKKKSKCLQDSRSHGNQKRHDEKNTREMEIITEKERSTKGIELRAHAWWGLLINQLDLQKHYPMPDRCFS